MEMETKEIQYLRGARGAMSSGKIDDGLRAYQMALSENSENQEAKYFNEFLNFTENSFRKGKNDIEYAFLFWLNSIQGAVEYIAGFDCSNYEKSIVITTMLNMHKCIPDYIRMADEYFSVDLFENGVLSFYWFGTYIKVFFQENQDFMKYAIDAWKEAIKLHLEYGFEDERYKIEDYAEEIKKIESDYVVPDKPVENIREKRIREEAEKAEKKAREEAEKTEKIAQAKKEKLKTYSYIALGVCIFFLLGALVGVDESTKDTLPVMLGISLISAIVFFVLRFKPELISMCATKIKGLQKIEGSKEKKDGSKGSDGKNDIDCEDGQ